MLGNTLSLRFWKGGLWPLLIGVAAFFILVGPRVLNPTNIRWLGEMGFSDPSTYQLGWSFFRHSDWSFPLGANPEYGLELSGSLVFSDSNVLFAFLFKSLSPLLPEPFQYFGIWLLACFVLQAWFGFKLVGLISDSSVIRAMGASLFVFAPPMLLRLWAHFNLVAHFLVVASIYLAPQVRQQNP
ncbi:MAG: hypothetical protein IPM37_24000 [Hahellaceae bacterium]|nr:hypothetical protein [Hahellaceae bacterium]